MSEYTDFVAMDRVDAATYLAHFRSETQPSLERFALTIGADLPFSPGALEHVWAAVEPKLAWREGYFPPPPGQPGSQLHNDQLDPAVELPSWFHHPSGAGYSRFSRESLWLIDGAARYLGETLIRVGTGQWASGYERTKNYMFQNQPVLVGTTAGTVSPMQTCAALAAKALQNATGRGPRNLSDVFRAWANPLD